MPAMPASPATPAKSPDAVKVEIYVMSQCPFAVRVVNAFKEVVDQLGPDIDLTLEYIGNVNGAELSSMHGPNEVLGDAIQLCAARVAPSRYLDFIVCQNENYRDLTSNWEGCAARAQLPVGRIRACVDGDEGRALVRASFGRAAARGAVGSPTIDIAGEAYQGGRAPKDFARAVCTAYKGEKAPPACASLPPVPEVAVTLLSDSRCKECDTTRIAELIKSRVGKPVFKLLDYGDAEGKALYDAIGGPLPVAVFDDSLAKDEEAATWLGRYLKPHGPHRVLSLQGTWLPTCADPRGCDRPECRDTFACREETPNSLELFVMSQCPYAVRALAIMPEIVKTLGAKLRFSVHYIADGDRQNGFSSLHGDAEVREDIRQLCAAQYYGKRHQFLDYVVCRNESIRSEAWESCAAGNIRAEVIRRCAEGDEGKELLERDIAIAAGLGIRASPTWVVNGRYEFSGLDADTVRQHYCAHNGDSVGCAAQGSRPNAPETSPGGCAGE